MPPYFLPRPAVPQDAATVAACVEALARLQANPEDDSPLAQLPVSRWQFLCILADTLPVLMHGSANPEITLFEPRQPNDATVFGNQNAVYAASDGIWAMFFAIVNRKPRVSLLNGSFRIGLPDGTVTDPYYFFSISRSLQDPECWQNGSVYILPRDTFRQNPPYAAQGVEVHEMHWASPEPVAPLARIAVTPDDFPFLHRVRNHDPAVIRERAKSDPGGFPWLEDGEGMVGSDASDDVRKMDC